MTGLKRISDLAIIAVVAIPAGAVGLIAAVAIRCTSRGPILFRQDRIGLNGELFEVLKFRTMLSGDNPVIPTDDRITKVGRILRRTSLDELPQLLNVVRGEMSVVGPRPTLPYQADKWSPEQRRRLEVLPGLTGLAQVNGRNDLSWADRIAYDIEYVDNQSLILDLKIVFKTASVLVSGAGAGATAADDPMVS